MLNRHRTSIVIALILPVLALRALLPAGFMPVADETGLRVLLCSQGLLQSGADHERTGGDLPAAGDLCPFALSVLNAPPLAQTTSSFDIPYTRRLQPSASSELPPATGPPRLTAARGPPLLS